MIENDKYMDIPIFSSGEQDASPIFYAGAGRGETVLRMTKALEQGTALLVLTGEEGSGKTMVCRVLEREASRLCYTVFFSKTVESFEDVVKKVALHLGLGGEGGLEGKGIDGTLDRLAAHLKRESTGLLIIFDEAENIYLATLERIRKMVDRLTEAGARLHIVFSGRETFLENYDQLSICKFQNSDQLQFGLEPLSEQEIGEYLQTCAHAVEQQDRRVFNDEIIRKIHSLANGNFRKTAQLAEESVRTHGDDTSFMVLLESVREEAGGNQRKTSQPQPHILRRSARYLPWLGGVGCLLVLLFFLARPDGGARKEQVQPTKAVSEKVAVAPVEMQKPSEEKQIEEKADAAPPLAATLQQPLPSTPPAPVTEEEATAGLGPSESLDDGPVEAVQTGDAGKEQPKAVEEKLVEVIRETPVKKKIAVPPEPVKLPPVAIAEARQQIRLDKPIKIKKELKPDQGGKAKITLRQPTIKERLVAKDRIPVDQLLQRRIAAGNAWAKKGKEDAYTMQLMALTDKNAEDNLKKMLAQPRYRQESDNFFIFRKSSGSPILFVFYGEYSTLAMAREAQTNLPPFLQVHQPYAISVKGAMDKVKR